ncbi:MAG: nucleotidyltransferase domain-containing protein [Deltaproteobacteria bacterium]|nr:nucleotidyltransferase domain-containing protein [Deltaproteobacteria bacterium]
MKNTIKNIFSRYPEIIAAYLFGSLAAGRGRRGSDADIAVLLDVDTASEKAMSIRLQLMAELEGFYERDAEVIVLNDASLFFISEVFRGKVVYDKDPVKRAGFESIKRREYFDFAYYLKQYRKAFLERIKTKGLSEAYGGR